MMKKILYLFIILVSIKTINAQDACADHKAEHFNRSLNKRVGMTER